MNRTYSFWKTITMVAVIGCVMIITAITAQAQTGLSVSISRDFLPLQNFDEPVDTGSGPLVDDAQVRLKKMKASVSYPIVFSEGRTVLVNEFSYQLIEFDYRNMSSSMERFHSGSYTLMLQHQLSKKWTLWTMATPALVSDFEADLSRDDFNFPAVTVFIRHYSEKLSVGYGAAYSTQFGSAVPLPVLALDWNNGKNWSVCTILPVSLELWYRPGPRLDLGLIVTGDGNNYGGDPEIYEVNNPELRYTMLTIGSAAKDSIAEKLNLNLEAGLIGLHTFKFYDGDNELESYNLKPSQCVRVGLTFGE